MSTLNWLFILAAEQPICLLCKSTDKATLSMKDRSINGNLIRRASVLSQQERLLPDQIYSYWGYKSRKRERCKDKTREQRALKSKSEVKWNRWKKRDGEEKQRSDGKWCSHCLPLKARIGLPKEDKREIIIRPVEAWQSLLGTAERQTVRRVKDWPCHWQWTLLTNSRVWSFTIR